MSDTLYGLPRWMFETPQSYFLVAITPEGQASIDGGHADPQGVAKARVLFERIRTIRPPAGTRYVMVRIDDVPPFNGEVNEGAIETLNGIHTLRRQRRSSEGQ